MPGIGFAPMGWKAETETDSGSAAFPLIPSLSPSGDPLTVLYPFSIDLPTYFEWWWRVKNWGVALSTASAFSVPMNGITSTGLELVLTSERDLSCCKNGRQIDFTARGGGGEEWTFTLYFSSPYDTVGGSSYVPAVKFNDVPDTWCPQFAMRTRHVNPGIGFDYNAWSDGRGLTDFTPSNLTFTFAGNSIPCFCPAAIPDFPPGATLSVDPVEWWEFDTGIGPTWRSTDGTQLIIPVPKGL